MLFTLTLARLLMLCHDSLIDKLMKYRLDKWTIRWTENWLNCLAMCDHMDVISGIKSFWRLVTTDVPQGSKLEQLIFNTFIYDLYDITQCSFSSFAEDTKPRSVADIPDGCTATSEG